MQFSFRAAWGQTARGLHFFLLLQIFQKRSAYHRVGSFGKGKAQGSAAGGLKRARYHPRAAEGLHHQLLRNGNAQPAAHKRHDQRVIPEAVRNSLTSVEKNTAYDKVWMPSSTECASGYYKFLFAEIDERKARFSGNGGGFRNGIRISSDGKYYTGYSWSELGTNSNNTMILGFAIGVTPTE